MKTMSSKYGHIYEFMHSIYFELHKEEAHSLLNFLPNNDLLFNKYNNSSSVMEL